METFYVFHQGMAAITDLVERPIDIIFGGETGIGINNEELIGSECIFKIDRYNNGMNSGNLVIDQDLSSILPNDLSITQFPVTEYLFAIHEQSFRNINETYNILEEQLKEDKLKAIFHPILVFPNGYPQTIYDETTIEIWVATNSDYNSETRLSEKLPVALPRKRFNFYTW